MRKYLLFIGMFLAVSAFFVDGHAQKRAASSKKGGKDPVLLDFPGKAQVTKSAFEYVYQKNNGGWEAVKSHTPAQYREYLDLYVNFKRKVLEAEELGLGNTESFKTEFEGYRKQLAQPYLIEKDFQEGLIKEAYERSKQVVSASHLLIGTSPDSPPADTLNAYNRALAFRDSIISGKISFEAVAQKYSEDPSARTNSGFLGYFSVFDMVYPFETGAFNTPVGQVSKPIRTGYGYHLIKVHDKMDSPGKQKVAHVIIRVGPQYSAKDSVQANNKIEEIYQKLQEGLDFSEAAQNYSDDPVSAKSGGDLGFGRLIPEMENAKRTLKEGEFSKPFKTSYGWHILKVTEVEPVKSFEESKSDIKSKISRDARSYLSREKLVERVKKEGKFSLNQESLDAFVNSIPKEKEAEYSRGMWRPIDSAAAVYKLPLYNIGSGSDVMTGTIMDYVNWYVKVRKGYDAASVRQATVKNIETFTEDICLKYEEAQLPKKYPEYRELLKEYRDGILLFTLTEDKVWRKAIEDTVGLRNYYETNKAKFQAGERIECTEYVSEIRAVVENVQRMLQKGKTENEIDSISNAESALNLRVRTQKFEKGKSPEEQVLFGQQPGFATEILKYGSGFRILVLKESIPAGQKSFEDAKPEAITQYQNYLEAEWLKALEKKYPVKVQEKVLKKLYK